MSAWRTALISFAAIATTSAAAGAETQEADRPSTLPRATWELGGGAGLRTLFGLNILGGDVTARLGLQATPRVGTFGECSYFRGNTPAGLATETVSCGVRLDLRPVAGLRVGGGVEGVYFDIARPSDSDRISTLGIGLIAFVRYIFNDSPQRILPVSPFIELQLDYVSLDTLHNPVAFWGPTLALGIRF